MALEAAVERGSDHYKLLERGEVDKQHTPRTHGGQHTGKVPIDFKGWYRTNLIERAPCAIECKETGSHRLDFSEKALEQNQLDAIRALVARAIQTWLVVDMTAEREVYRVDGRDVVAFAAAPWRASLSLAWLRAVGELCKESDRDNPRRRAVWWLDTRLHPGRAAAGLAVAAERAQAAGAVVELYPASGLNQGLAALTMRDLLSTKPKRDASELERIQWQNRFSEWELERNIREAKKLASRVRKSGWGRR